MGSTHRRKPDTNNLAQQREYLQRLEAEDVEEGFFCHRDQDSAEGSFDIETLRTTYQSVCEAVSEFELSASTLRSNSSAMTLSKKLAMQSAADIFIVLRDFRPRTRPEIPIQAGKRISMRMEKWARTMKGEHEGGDPWKAIKQQVESLSMNSSDEDEERERERSQKSEEESGEKDSDWWRVPDQWRDADFEREYIRFQDDKKRDDTKARMQLRELGIINEGENTGSEEGVSGKQLENVYTDSWGGGWLKRAEAEYIWMGNDQKEHPEDWMEDWLRMRLWWNDVREWVERWRWRNDVVEEFEKTIKSLLLELGKIDGSVSARELNVFEKSYDDECHHRLVEHADSMKIALLAGDEGRFAFHYNSALDLIGGVLRSKGVKQGLDALIKKQDHFRNSFMDFATVAIFFSSITATTLQFSFQSGDSTISSMIVNLCWFASLILSIASATNSLLGVLVHQSPEYLRPSQNFHFRFLQNWFKYIPPALLTCSGVLFLVGFCAFSFLSTTSFLSQGKAVQTITVMFTATKFAALLTIFFLAFTQAAVQLVYSATSLLIYASLTLPLCYIALFQFLLAFPFVNLYYGIRHEDPPPVWDRLWGGFRILFKALYDVFQPLENWMKVQEIVGPHWEALTRFFASTFSGTWRRLKKFVWKPAPMAPATAPDDTGHQSIGMGSVRGGTPPIGEARNS